jgi:hypothetical protein
MMRIWFLIAAVSFLSLSCAHQALNVPSGDTLYPYGKYRHSVKVHVLKPEPRTMDLRGVVAVNADSIKVVGLSGIGTTIFRIEEDRHTGVVKKDFYLEIVRQHQDRFMEFYSLIRELVTAPKGATDFIRGEAHYVVSDPDDDGIYRTVHITHPQVNIDIEVTDYAP